MHHLASLIVLEHALVLTLTSPQHCLAIEPTRRYSYGFNVKDPFGNGNHRRQHKRKKEHISLKPPPEDWPAVTMGAADFIVVEPTVATSISPLLAYQAQLEKEFLEQQRRGRSKNVLTMAPTEPTSLWSSSEEELKKLLDPNELIKHNKLLRPFIRAVTTKTVGKQGRQPLKNVESATKPPVVEERVTAIRKRRRKTKLGSGKSITKPTSRRGRKKKEKEEGDSDSPASSKELKKRKRRIKIDSSEKPVKTKRQTKKVKQFTFATNYLENDVVNINKESEGGLITPIEGTPQTPCNHTTLSYMFVTTQLQAMTQELREEATIPIEAQTMMTTETKSTSLSISEEVTTPLDSQTSTTTETKLTALAVSEEASTPLESQTSTTESKLTTLAVSEEASTPLESQTTATTETKETTLTVSAKATVSTVPTTVTISTTDYTTPSTTKSNREEIREKRRKIREEMAKELEREELSSFGDHDSDWRTSEDGKIPILSVTPRIALMELLKHKIVNFVDKIVRESPMLTEDEQLHHERKYSSWNDTNKS